MSQHGKDTDGSVLSRPELEWSMLDVLAVLYKRKALLLSVVFATASIAAIVAFLLPNYYTATAKLLPPQNTPSSATLMLSQLGGLAGLAGSTLTLKNPNDLYVGILRSRTIADALIQRFDLQKIFDAYTQTDSRRILNRRSNIAAGRDGLITIEFEDSDPKRAAAVVNGYIEALYELTQTLAVTEASQRRLFFAKQLHLAKEDLARAEVSLKRTQEATGLIKLDDQGRAIIEAIATLRAQVAAREVQLGAMRLFATGENPEFLRLQQEIAGLKAQLLRLEKTDGTGQGDIFVPTGRVPEAGLEYVRKLRDVKYHEAMYELLAKQYELARVDEARDTSVIQVLDRPVEPDKKSWPNRTLIVALATLIAGVISVGLVLALEWRETARRHYAKSQHG